MTAVRTELAVAAPLLLVGAAIAAPAAADADDEFAVVPDGRHVEAPVDDGAAVESALAAALVVDRRDVRADDEANTVEVLVGGVSAAEFADALDAVGIEASEADVRDRPAPATMERFESVLTTRYESAGVEANVTVASDRLRVAPEADGETARKLASVRGVELWAAVPTKDGTDAEQVLSGDAVSAVGTVQESGEAYSVPVGLNASDAEAFQSAMREYGFAREEGVACDYDREEPLGANLQGIDADERCLLTRLGDEVVSASGVSSDLAARFRSGAFAADPQFRLDAPTREEAELLEHTASSGPLSAEAKVTRRTTASSASQAAPSGATVPDSERSRRWLASSGRYWWLVTGAGNTQKRSREADIVDGYSP